MHLFDVVLGVNTRSLMELVKISPYRHQCYSLYFLYLKIAVQLRNYSRQPLFQKLVNVSEVV